MKPIDRRETSALVPWPLFAVIFAAFIVECLAIQGINLGLDGGLSLALGVLPLPDALRFLAHDVHPPLYYVVLRGWLAVVGSQPFAVKYLGLCFATLSVAVFGAWIRRFVGLDAAVMGALLLAVSPILVGDAATVRDLSLGVCFVILGCWSYCEARRAAKPRRWDWLYLFGSVLAIWTSFLAVGALLGQAIHLAIRRDAVRLYRVIVVAALSVVPWLGFALSQGWLATVVSGGPTNAPTRPGFLDNLRGAASLLVTGSDSTRLLVLLAALAAIGIITVPGLRRLAQVPLGDFTLVETLVTFGFALAVSSTWLKLDVPSRYLATVLPVYLLLIVALASRAGRWKAWLITGLLLILNLESLGSWNRRPMLPISFWDPRGVQAFLDQRLSARDQIVFLTLEQAGYYEALSPRPRRWTAIPVGTGYLERDASANAARLLTPLLTTDRTIWLVEYHGVLGNGQRDVEGWLAHHAFPVNSTGLDDSDVHPFLTGASLGPDRAPGISFADGVGLVGVAYSKAVRPGDLALVRLTWRAEHPLARDLTVFVHLVDQRGQTIAQQDTKPVDGFDPTTSWHGTIVDRHGIVVPAGTPPGNAWIEVGLYDGSGRLPVAGRGDGVARFGPLAIEQ